MKAATQLRNAIFPAALLLSLPSLALAERGFQASDMVSMDRFSSPVLSPDGRKLVFAKRTVDMASGKATTSLWMEDLFARDSAPPAAGIAYSCELPFLPLWN
jgi:hypothetical protein